MLKKFKIKNFGFDIEPHEVFLDKLIQSREEDWGVAHQRLEVPLKKRTSYALFGIFFLSSVILFSRVFYYQVFEGEKLYIQASNNKKSVNLVVPQRGVIYDKNMKQLVFNYPAYDLVCDRAHFSQGEFFSETVLKEISEIAELAGLPKEKIISKIKNTDSSEVLITENINHEQLLILETKINNFPACRIRQNTVRNYVFGSVISHVLGYTGRINKEEYSTFDGYSISDYIGKTGLENYYETYLRGKPGQLKPKALKTEKESLLVEPQSGENLVLNIDIDLQTRLYNALEKSIKNIEAQKGAAVAVNPKNGAVLALVSYPSYDNNLFSGGISPEDYRKILSDPNQPLFNRVIAGKYPTGSTIKPLEALAALQEKIISPTKLINDEGYIIIPHQHNPEIIYRFGGVRANGWIDMKKAIAVSSNVYFYTIGGGYGDQKGLGPGKIKKYLSLFGWDQKTGIDLPGESSGFIPDPAWKKATKKQGWWDGDTYNLSIGQSDLQTTPLQVAMAYCAIANGGVLYKPQVVNKIISSDSKKIIKEFEPQVIRANFIDSDNLRIIREGMYDGVYKSYGLSTYLSDLPVKVAAKTGTAEIGYKDRFNVWSSVFAPYDDPQIVLVVTIESVKGLGAATLPVAHDVLGWYFKKNK